MLSSWVLSVLSALVWVLILKMKTVTFSWVLVSSHSFLTVACVRCWVLVWKTKMLPYFDDGSFPAPLGWY